MCTVSLRLRSVPKTLSYNISIVLNQTVCINKEFPHFKLKRQYLFYGWGLCVNMEFTHYMMIAALW